MPQISSAYRCSLQMLAGHLRFINVSFVVDGRSVLPLGRIRTSYVKPANIAVEID